MAWGPRAMGRSFEQTKRGCGMHCVDLSPRSIAGDNMRFRRCGPPYSQPVSASASRCPPSMPRPLFSFAPIGKAQASSPDEVMLAAMDAEPQALTFLPPPANEPDDIHRSIIDPSMGHGRFAAPQQRAAPPGPAPCRQPAHRRRARRLLPRRLLHAAHRHPPGRGRAGDQGRSRAGRSSATRTASSASSSSSPPSCRWCWKSISA